MIHLTLIILYLVLIGNVTGEHYCPLLGPVFPAPKHLSKSGVFKRAKHKISSAIDEAISEAKTSKTPIFYPENTSISLEVFSSHDKHPLFYYSYTSPATRNAKRGVQKVDRDTIFRIGSCSKLWTVFLFLIKMGDEPFNEPVAKYIPEIKIAAENIKSNATARSEGVNVVRWDEVTVGELASQLAGITRDYGFMDLGYQPANMTELGFPPLPESDLPPCGPMAICDKQVFMDGLIKSHPIVPITSTPIYSNAAFQLLAYALEGMTGQSFREMFENDLIKPLSLTHSSYGEPDDKHGIIPDSPHDMWWSFDMKGEAPAGGTYASTKDMSTLGSAILSSKMIPSSLTRRWMKPLAHTSEMHNLVGAPWEIYSIPEPRTIDLYTKSGDISAYSAMIALSPDHDVGFTIMSSGPSPSPSGATRSIPNLIVQDLISALEDAAKEEADHRFSGTYALKHGKNSSITLVTDEGPGLKVTSWMNNNEDMLEAAALLMQFGDRSQINIRLQPTGLESPGRISFRAIMTSPTMESSVKGPFSLARMTWVMADSQKYGNVALDEFLFDVDDDGNAVSLSPRALRVSLPRKHGHGHDDDKDDNDH
ncbi:Beta-lactamase [Aspergillus sclerotialis]|uniref:Beta-lactamase n=1 Tax=Aspergillus sclerotialis TaxID=2070753 RepID=A0A3A3A270_9EURO|nr:Beta-lactamase [Aspergillus sclerotialis]